MTEVIELAKAIATKAHKGQFRWDGTTPYITHPESVANSVMTEEAKAVAWLHDVIEDTDVTASDLLAQGVPENIVNLVKVLSKYPGQDYLEYILNVSHYPIATYVKIADIKHNLQNINKEKNKNMHLKYRMALYILEHLRDR